jgi:hypothetical protein
MRRFAAALVAAGALAGSAAAATPQPGTAKALPAAPGAQPAALSLTIVYEAVCGHPRTSAILVALPAAMGVPAHLADGAVLVNGRRPAGVAVAGHLVSIRLAPFPGRGHVTCLSIAPATLTVSFTDAARLANPSVAGSYTVRTRLGAQTFAARLGIRP